MKKRTRIRPKKAYAEFKKKHKYYYAPYFINGVSIMADDRAMNKRKIEESAEDRSRRILKGKAIVDYLLRLAFDDAIAKRCTQNKRQRKHLTAMLRENGHAIEATHIIDYVRLYNAALYIMTHRYPNS